MKWKEIASRLNGISSPILGVQWIPPEAEVAVARRVITILEDRRVLYAQHAMEIPAHCVTSANEIRGALTTEIAKIAGESYLLAPLRGIRQAARDFVAELGRLGEDRSDSWMQHPWSAALFGEALGRFRSTSGIHIASLASTYHLDVEGDLERVLPSKILKRDV